MGLIDPFTWKLLEIFGENVDPRELISMTRDSGMVGLVLHIFQSIN